MRTPLRRRRWEGCCRGRDAQPKSEGWAIDSLSGHTWCEVRRWVMWWHCATMGRRIGRRCSGDSAQAFDRHQREGAEGSWRSADLDGFADEGQDVIVDRASGWVGKER